MGDVLARPVTEKHPFDYEVSYRPAHDWAIRVGGSAMQGWRRQMEDAHDVILDIDPNGPGRWSWFGVFDGHCGKQTALFAGAYLGKILVKTEAWKAGEIKAALREAFLTCDRVLREGDKATGVPIDFTSGDVSIPPARDGSGSTAVTCLVGTNKDGAKKIYCANAGDSRAVLCRGGVAIPLSHDHKPNLESERARILAAGAFVAMGRVMGNLALSRALGDFDFKGNVALKPEQQAVSPEPDVEEQDLHPDDEFIVIACDGVWDVLTNERVVESVAAKIKEGVSLSSTCEHIFDICLAPSAPGLGCDNMTMMIIDLRRAYKDGIVTTGSATTAPAAAAAHDADGSEPAAGASD